MNLAEPFRHLEAVLFDLDGTFVDTAKDFAEVVQEMRVELGLVPMAYDEIRSQVSRGGSGLVEACLDCPVNAVSFPALLQDFLSRYAAVNGNQASLFEGVQTLVDCVEACTLPWGIVTNKPEQFTVPLLNKLMLGHASVQARAKVVICPDHVKYKKPHPESLTLAARHLAVAPERVIYVGDDARDIQAGRAAGMLTCAFSGGFIQPGSDPSQWQADYQVESFLALKQLLFKH